MDFAIFLGPATPSPGPCFPSPLRNTLASQVYFFSAFSTYQTLISPYSWVAARIILASPNLSKSKPLKPD